MLYRFGFSTCGDYGFGWAQPSSGNSILAKLTRLFRFVILCLISILLTNPVSAGNIVLTGHDDDFHSFFHTGSNAVAQAQAMIAFARSGAPNPSLPVLTFDHGHELTSLLTSLGIPFSNIDPDAGIPATSLFDVTRFSAIIVASDLTCGGCDNTPTSSTNLNGAATAIAAFFSAGGGIVAFAGAANTSYYRFVPASASGFGNPPSFGYVQTALGAALGIPAVNGDPTHNFFFTPGTNGVSAAYGVIETLGVGGQIETIACQGCGAAEIGAFFTFLGAPGSTTNPTASFAEPVNTAIGNYFTSHTDLVVRGVGFPFRFNRFYNSRDPYSGPLGAGWTHSFNVFLTEDNVAGTISIKQQDGSVITFSRTQSGAYIPSTVGLFDQLQKNNDGSFALIKKDRSTLTFTPDGRLAAITDHNNNSQHLIYDLSGNLVSVTDTAGRGYSFAYDTFRRINSIADPSGRNMTYTYDANGNLASCRDPLGNTTRYLYDGGHHLVSATDPRGVMYVQNTYDPQGRVIGQTNGRGFVTTFAYNTPSAGITSITDARGSVTKHVYDSNLRLIKVINAQDSQISYSYDVNNNRVGVTNENGKVIAFTYDSQGNLISLKNSVGGVVSFSYDGQNNLVSTRDPRGNTALLSYDAVGNLVKILDPLGNAASFAYDRRGELISLVNPLGAATAFSFDEQGNLVRVTNPLGKSNNFAYDMVGRLTSIVDPKGNALSFVYDALNHLVQTKDALGNTQQYEYDANGTMRSRTDAAGHTTTFQRDAANNLVGIIDAIGGLTQYEYDQNNNCITWKNARGSTASFGFDSLNRLVSVVNGLGYARSYSYDAAGNLASLIDEDGKLQSFGYDAMNRRTSASYADGTLLSFSYDLDGNRVAMIDHTGDTTYSYDALNRLQTVHLSRGRTIAYQYDPAGRRTALSYPDGRMVKYSYDLANRLTSVTDWNGFSTSYAYDDRGKLVNQANSNDSSSAYVFDAAGRLVQVNNRDRDKAFSLTYTLDSNGNKTQVTSDRGIVHTYHYDALNRLSAWRNSDGQLTQYVYDAVGNRISMTSPSGSVLYSYDAVDRLVAAGTTTYKYDPNGNLVSKSDPGWTTEFLYDSFNRLTNVNSRTVSAFGYDGDGNRISQQTGSQAFSYTRDVASRFPWLINETGSNGEVDFVYGNALVSESGSPFQYFYQMDGEGNVVNVTNAAGALNANYAYDPWGNAVSPEPPKVDAVHDKNQLRFVAGELDDNTGLYYFLRRYYDPQIGRFITRDRFPGFTSMPNTQNAYTYAGDNPLSFADRGGDSFGADDGIALLTGAVGGFVGQYLSDVGQNLDSGATGLDIFVPTSSWQDFTVSTLGGAAAADLGLNGFEFGGPVGAGLGVSVGTAATDLLKGWVDGKSINWDQVAVDSTVSGLTGGLLESFPHVPGALPNLFSDSFFFGAHAEDAWVKTAIGSGVGFITSLVTNMVPNATDQNLSGFLSMPFQYISTKQIK